MDFRALDPSKIVLGTNNKIRYGGAGKVQCQTPRVHVKVLAEDSLEIVSRFPPEFEAFCEKLCDKPVRRIKMFDGSCDWFGAAVENGKTYEAAMIWTFDSVHETWGLRVTVNQIKVYGGPVVNRPMFLEDVPPPPTKKRPLFLEDVSSFD